MTQIISDSPAPCIGVDFIDSSQVTLSWIQSLSPESKDAALLRFCKMVEAKPTLVESFTLNQVLYRTISGGVFTESAESAAKRTGHDRKTILKGLDQALEQNILEENKRPGTSSEYWFKPVEEWLPQPVVRSKDVQKGKVVQFSSTENLQKPVADVLVLKTDDPETDPNNVVVINEFLENTTEEVSIPHRDTPSIWRRLPDGSRYAQIPPIYDQDTGMEIQRQMDLEGLTAQSVVGRAMSFCKVPLMLLNLLANIGRALANSCLKAQSEPTVAQSQPVAVVASTHLSKTLEIIGVSLPSHQLRKCIIEYGEDVMLNAANELKRTEMLVNKENPTGYFLGCLKNGMGQKPTTVQEAEPKELFDEEQAVKRTCSSTDMGQKPVASFSHVETNPRVAVARLIIDGQYQRAAIVAGLYGVDYEELVHECGLADDPRATILLRKVTT